MGIAEKFAEKVLESWSGSEQDLIKIASKQKKPIQSFADVHRLAKKQIAKEFKAMSKERQKEELSKVM